MVRRYPSPANTLLRRVADAFDAGALLVEPDAEVDFWATLQRCRARPWRAVVVTHAHEDHVRGADAVAKSLRLPLFGPRSLADAEDLFGWKALRTPGHCKEHVAFFDGETLLAGDLVNGDGIGVLDAGQGGSYPDHMASLRRAIALGASEVVVSHGGALPAGALEAALVREERFLAWLRPRVHESPDVLLDRLVGDWGPDAISGLHIPLGLAAS